MKKKAEVWVVFNMNAEGQGSICAVFDSQRAARKAQEYLWANERYRGDEYYNIVKMDVLNIIDFSNWKKEHDAINEAMSMFFDWERE